LNNSPCAIPVELRDFNNGEKPHVLSWFTNSDALIQPDLFQVEYGEKDFALGTGTKIIVNESPFLEGQFEEGKIYDFYVQSDCNGVSDSPWIGPVSFIADAPQNQCLVPLNLTNTDPAGSVRARIRFEGQGDCKWEGAYSKRERHTAR